MNKENEAFEFDAIASGPFFPIYPEIAQQIIDKTEITKGICIDIGSGGGYLGLSIAKKSDLDVFLIDNNKDAVKIAKTRIAEWNLKDKVSILFADVHNMPFSEDSIDLVVSRGSIWFWQDKIKAFNEILRVLKKGGMAYIGSGFGTAELKKHVDINMKKIDPEWPRERQKVVADNDANKFEKIMLEVGLSQYEVIDDERGLWVVFEK